MLELAPSAERHVLLLVRHYRRKHRFEAEYRLIKTLEDATHAVQRGTAKFHPAPPRHPRENCRRPSNQQNRSLAAMASKIFKLIYGNAERLRS
jgi:hypothetical protein